MLSTILTSIVAGLITAALAAIIAGWFGKTRLPQVLAVVVEHFTPRVLRNDHRPLGEGRQGEARYLIRWLTQDQSTSGIHLGEFGLHAAREEEILFQNNTVDIAGKPRLYLTWWPCYVLSQIGQGERELELASNGVRQLLGSGEVLARATTATHPEHVVRIASLRHTFRAAQILQLLDPSNPMLSELVGKMVDSASKWKRPEGGWPQFESDRKPDLWATAYGVAFLHDIVRDSRDGPAFDSCVLNNAILEALEFIQLEWNANRWKYAQASSAHNGVQIFHEVYEAVRERGPDFLVELHEWIESWLTPTGHLAPRYVEACKNVSSASGNARIAYALFQSGNPARRWVQLYEAAVRLLPASINSADAAFLLHMNSYL